MAPELSPLNERFVAQALAAGLFASRESLLDQAVDTLRAAMRETVGDESGKAQSFDDTFSGPPRPRFETDDPAFDGESLGGRAWDSDAVMRRIFESLAEAGVRTND